MGSLLDALIATFASGQSLYLVGKLAQFEEPALDHLGVNLVAPVAGLANDDLCAGVIALRHETDFAQAQLLDAVRRRRHAAACNSCTLPRPRMLSCTSSLRLMRPLVIGSSTLTPTNQPRRLSQMLSALAMSSSI